MHVTKTLLIATLLGLALAPLASAQPPMARPPVCEESLAAQTHENGDILLTWDVIVENEGSFLFYRVLRDGEVIAEIEDVNETEYLDTDTEAGATYAYRVEAHGEGAATPTVFTVCGEIEATAVPFFGTAALLAVALVGTVGAYALLRRR